MGTTTDLMSALFHATRETRFATNFIMLGSLVKVKRELQQTVVDGKWEEWVERSDSQLKRDAQTCKALVMDDRWYTRAEDLLLLVGCVQYFVLLNDRVTFHQYVQLSWKCQFWRAGRCS